MIASAIPNAKLTELRCKTNRDLVSLINNKLERGLEFVRKPAGRNSAMAEREFAEVEALLPLLTGTNPLVRRSLEVRLAELRLALDRIAVPSMHARAAC